MKKFLFAIFTIALIALFTSCSTRSPQKRLTKLLDEHPELLKDSVRTVNVLIHDTIVREQHIIDTIIITDCKDKPIHITKEDSKAKVEYNRDKNGKSTLKAECKADTVYIDRWHKAKVDQKYLIEEKPVYKDRSWLDQFKDGSIYFAIGLIIGIILKYFFRKS